MTAVMEKHIGLTECFCYDKKMVGFAAQEHIAEFKDENAGAADGDEMRQVQGQRLDAFLMSQMWDCQEDRSGSSGSVNIRW